MEQLANARTFMESNLGELASFLLKSAGKVNLDLAGLLVLADLQGVAQWTALTGTSAWLDIFIIAPGLHRQAAAPDLCKGEYPACAAMTTGYVFRVENPATVSYLQRVGRPGHLTTLSVWNTAERTGAARRFLSSIYDFEEGRTGPTIAYFVAVALTMAVLDALILVRDLWGIATIATLMLVRFINVAIIRRRSRPGWFGAPEPGFRSDLLVLLSQDRWIRIQGLTDDVKAVTSGAWFQECTLLQNVLLTTATLLTYFDVVMAANASQTGKLLLVFLLLANSGLLGLVNYASTSMTVHGRAVTVSSGPKKYDRRLTLAKELIKEFGRTDCFVGMGMIQPHQAKDAKKSYQGAVTM
ncbi:Hypothetical predicted protein [Lecanosticta acicola]|uniref:Uncharacterized protein n=1 Tax=Lecanosticta acicola TaxID=111012 RepID=A0AAI8YUV6_9PEZI|nr:Hypothetical predicted protein [Lecanosticta acicola]